MEAVDHAAIEPDAAPEGDSARSAGWEIVDLGEETWEVVLGNRPRGAGRRFDRSASADSPPDWVEQPPESLVARLARTDERLGTVERRVEELGQNDQLTELKLARAEAVRSLDRRGTALRQELTEIYEQAEQRVAETQTQGKPSWRQLRHERKLARQERDRKIRKAERRLEERSEESLASIERAADEASMKLQERMLGVLDNEDRLIGLIDQISAAEERVRAADERAVAARERALGSEGAFEL